MRKCAEMIGWWTVFAVLWMAIEHVADRLVRR